MFIPLIVIVTLVVVYFYRNKIIIKLTGAEKNPRNTKSFLDDDDNNDYGSHKTLESIFNLKNEKCLELKEVECGGINESETKSNGGDLKEDKPNYSETVNETS